jgi:hypothetical protein
MGIWGDGEMGASGGGGDREMGIWVIGVMGKWGNGTPVLGDSSLIT